MLGLVSGCGSRMMPLRLRGWLSTTTSLRETVVGNIKSSMDECILAAVSSDMQTQALLGETNRQRCCHGARLPIAEIRPEGGVDGPSRHTALERLSWIPHVSLHKWRYQ